MALSNMTFFYLQDYVLDYPKWLLNYTLTQDNKHILHVYTAHFTHFECCKLKLSFISTEMVRQVHKKGKKVLRYCP